MIFIEALHKGGRYKQIDLYIEAVFIYRLSPLFIDWLSSLFSCNWWFLRQIQTRMFLFFYFWFYEIGASGPKKISWYYESFPYFETLYIRYLTNHMVCLGSIARGKHQNKILLMVGPNERYTNVSWYIHYHSGNCVSQWMWSSACHIQSFYLLKFHLLTLIKTIIVFISAWCVSTMIVYLKHTIRKDRWIPNIIGITTCYLIYFLCFFSTYVVIL